VPRKRTATTTDASATTTEQTEANASEQTSEQLDEQTAERAVESDDPTIADVVAQLAPVLGDDITELRVTPVDWEKFLEEGVLVELHFHRWRAEVQLTLEHLGIVVDTKEERDAILRTLNPGSRYLLPRELLKEAQTATDSIRYNLTKHRVQTFWGKYVHVSRYLSWRENHQQKVDEYLAIGQRIFDQWDELIKDTLVRYNSIALQTYNRLVDQNRRRQTPLELPDLETFRTRYLEEMMASIPTPEVARDSFRVTWELTLIPMQRQVAQDRAAAEYAWQKSRETARVEAELEMLADLKRSEAERAAEGIKTFVADLQAAIQGEVFGVVTDALDALTEGSGKLSGNSVRGLRTLVEKVATTKFWDDPELDARMAQLDILASAPAKQRDSEQLAALLRQLGAEARLILSQVDRAPARSTRDIGIPDDVDELETFIRAPRQVRDVAIEPPVDELEETPPPSRRGRSRRATSDELEPVLV
jgi:hypothetical protein